MQLDSFITRFQHTAKAIQSLAQDVSPEQARWMPSPEEWSILEVINHLYDEEREDFRTRLDMTLQQSDQPWPGIDPEGWATARKYNERELTSSLDNFLQEREASLAWLKGLTAPDWDKRKQHPLGFELAAGDLLAAWLAHDCLHLRQLSQLHWQYLTETAAPYSTRYAGPWD